MAFWVTYRSKDATGISSNSGSDTSLEDGPSTLTRISVRPSTATVSLASSTVAPDGEISSPFLRILSTTGVHPARSSRPRLRFYQRRVHSDEPYTHESRLVARLNERRAWRAEFLAALPIS